MKACPEAIRLSSTLTNEVQQPNCQTGSVGTCSSDWFRDAVRTSGVGCMPAPRVALCLCQAVLQLNCHSTDSARPWATATDVHLVLTSRLY